MQYSDKSESEKVILVDADGVLVNWIDGFHDWMKTNGYELKDRSNYDIAEGYGISGQDAGRLAQEYCDSDVIQKLKPMKDSLEYVQKFKDEGYKFYCITSISDDVASKCRRITNLCKLFGGDAFLGIECLGCGADKDKELANWKNSNFFWIEDHIKNADIGLKLGLRPILLNQPYNEGEEVPYPRAETWKDIYEIITNE